MGVPTKETKIASPTSTNIRVVEVAPEAASLALPADMEEEEEVHVAGFLAPALPVEPAIAAVAKEEEPIMAGLPTVKAIVGVLRATTELLIDKVAEGTVVEALEEVAGEAATYEVIAIPAMMPPEVGRLVGILLVGTMGNSSQLHGSPPCTSQVPNPIPRRPIDHLIRCL